MQEYNFVVEYRPESQMRHADALSRNPVRNSEQETFSTFHVDVSDSDWNDVRSRYLIQTLKSVPQDNEE